MSQASIVLERLQELRFETVSSSEVLTVPPQRCSLARDLGSVGGLPYFVFIEQVLYGIRNNRLAGTASLHFSGSSSVVVERHCLTDECRVLVNGVPAALKSRQSAGEFLFGRDRAGFRASVHVNGRDFVVPAGAQALHTYLRNLLVPGEPATEKKEVPQLEDLQTIRSKRGALEKQLERLPLPETVAPVQPIDPPAIGGLVRALEQTRSTERRILERRIQMAEEIKRTTSSDAAWASPAAGPILSRLEQMAAELEKIESRVFRLKKSTGLGASFMVKAGLLISLALGGACAAVGSFLEDVMLTRFAIAFAAAAVLGVIAFWVLRMDRIMKSTREAKKLKSDHMSLRDQACKLCMRVGTAATVDELTPEVIRGVVDRTSRRDLSKTISDVLLPYIDSEKELVQVRKLHKALETPLAEAAEIRDPDLPPVPIVRLTQSAMEMLSDWTRALRQSEEQVAKSLQQRIRTQIERELIEESLEKLKATERTLELNKSRAIQPKDEPSHRAARHLNQVFLPMLHRYLGHEAPRSFNADLSPQFAGSPSSEVNSFIALVVRLFNPDNAGGNIQALGSVVVDPGLAVGSTLEQSLGLLLAHSPLCGRLVITHTRPELEGSFVRSMALELESAMGIAQAAPASESGESSLYSGHDHSTPQPAGSPDLLLQPSSD